MVRASFSPEVLPAGALKGLNMQWVKPTERADPTKHQTASWLSLNLQWVEPQAVRDTTMCIAHGTNSRQIVIRATAIPRANVKAGRQLNTSRIPSKIRVE